MTKDQIRQRVLILKKKLPRQYTPDLLQKHPKIDIKKVRDVINLRAADEKILLLLESFYK